MAGTILVDKDEIDGASRLVYGFGNNTYGQMGDGESCRTTKIKPVFLSVEIATISCGEYHTLLITKNNEAYTCGSNYYGQLGLGDYDNRLQPTKLSLKNVTHGCCGNSYTAIVSDKRIYTFGRNIVGCLGLGKIGEKNCLPVPVEHIYFAKTVSCGYFCTACIDEYGDIYVWGGEFDTPQQIYIAPPMKSVSCGHDCTVFLSTDGRVFPYGNFSARGYFDYPRPLKLDIKAKCVVCGISNIGMISEEGDVYIEDHIINLGTADSKLKIKHAVDLQMSAERYGILTKRGKFNELRIIGRGLYGELGIDGEMNFDMDKIVPIDRVEGFSLGIAHTLVYKKASFVDTDF